MDEETSLDKVDPQTTPHPSPKIESVKCLNYLQSVLIEVFPEKNTHSFNSKKERKKKKQRRKKNKTDPKNSPIKLVIIASTGTVTIHRYFLSCSVEL